MKTDNSKIKFGIKLETVTYGDRRKFVAGKILMRDGEKVVGVEELPRRNFKTRSEANISARARIAELKSHRLFVIRVTRKHIEDGIGRNCDTCAISQALWHNQERMGLPKFDYGFEVSPYGAFMDPRGLVINPKFHSDKPQMRIPADSLPQTVINYSERKTVARKFYDESMVDWAEHFDDWYDSQFETLAEWRKKHGYTAEDGDRPYKPSPCSFVLDLDAFKKFQDN